MSETQNTQVVKDAYAAFQRGDVNGILAKVDDNVDWHAVKGTEGVVPTAGARRGRAAVGEFFSQVNTSIAFDAFEPREFVAQGDMVVAIGQYRGKSKETGRPLTSDWVMMFTISSNEDSPFWPAALTRRFEAKLRYVVLNVGAAPAAPALTAGATAAQLEPSDAG